MQARANLFRDCSLAGQESVYCGTASCAAACTGRDTVAGKFTVAHQFAGRIDRYVAAVINIDCRFNMLQPEIDINLAAGNAVAERAIGARRGCPEAVKNVARRTTAGYVDVIDTDDVVDAVAFIQSYFLAPISYGN